MHSAAKAYESLIAHLRELACVSAIHEQLAWDELTLLPDEATEHRGKQLAYIAGRQHALASDPRLDDWLLEAQELATQDEVARVNVAELAWRHERSKQVPQTLVEELARVTTTAQHEWALARQQDDFGRFGIWLDRIVKLKREQARCWTADDDLYAPLVAEYESGLPYHIIVRSLDELARRLPEVVERRMAGQAAQASSRPLTGMFPVAHQQAFARELAQDVGFDFRRGRIDSAVHPFTTHISAHDCRIALRYDERDLAPLVSVLMHELGHALYDQGLPPEEHGLPIGEPISLSVHEAQARLWENAIGRSEGFWRFLLPRIEAVFPGVMGRWTVEQIAAQLQRVDPGPNRVRADEVTYNLHIVIRVELERALLRGDLQAADVPAVWNAAYRRLLKITPDSNPEGCLQDGHWAAGMFGYFPTYTLGNILMALQQQKLHHDLGPIDELCSRGDFTPIADWLRANLYCLGKRMSTLDWATHLGSHNSDQLDIEPLINRLSGGT